MSGPAIGPAPPGGGGGGTSSGARETQPERTVLSWQRTGLGVLAVAGLLARAAVDGGAPVPRLASLVTAVVVTVAGVALVAVLSSR